MLNFIIGAICGGIIIGAVSGVRKLARIRRLKKELKYIKERNDISSRENEILIAQISDCRDENKSLEKQLKMWEPLSFRIAKEYPKQRDQRIHIPEMGVELIDYFRNEVNRRNEMIHDAREIVIGLMDPDKKLRNSEILTARDPRTEAEKFLAQTKLPLPIPDPEKSKS